MFVDKQTVTLSRYLVSGVPPLVDTTNKQLLLCAQLRGYSRHLHYCPELELGDGTIYYICIYGLKMYQSQCYNCALQLANIY